MAKYIKYYDSLGKYLEDNEIEIIENPTDEDINTKLYYNFDYYNIDSDDESIAYYFGDTNETFGTETLRIGLKTMETRLFPEYRNKIYEYIKDTLSPVLTDKDLDIICKLISFTFGDLYMRTKLLPWEINIDRCSDENLKSLSSLIRI